MVKPKGLDMFIILPECREEWMAVSFQELLPVEPYSVTGKHVYRPQCFMALDPHAVPGDSGA